MEAGRRIKCVSLMGKVGRRKRACKAPKSADSDFTQDKKRFYKHVKRENF